MSQNQLDRSPLSAVLLVKGGTFFLYEPGLSVIGSGKSAEEAYGKFVGAKRDFLEQIERAGLLEGQLSPTERRAATEQSAATAPLPATRGIASELGLFLAKTCITLLILAGIGATGAIAAKRSIDQLVSNVSQEISRRSEQFKAIKPISMADIAAKAADIVRDVKAMPEESKESLRQSIGILSREATPIIEAWRNPPSLAEPNGKPVQPPAANSPGR